MNEKSIGRVVLASTFWFCLQTPYSAYVRAEEVYFEDFEGIEDIAGPEWSLEDGTPPPLTTAPNGSTKFLGQLGDETNRRFTRLTLTDLPDHEEITLSFDLDILCTWDGNAQSEEWELRLADGTVLLHTSFSNIGTVKQAYPGSFPGSDHDEATGAALINSLGYDCLHPPIHDAVYRFPNDDWSFTFSHAGETLEVIFEGFTNQPIVDESWGLDNVKVEVPGCLEEAGLMAYYPFNGDTNDYSGNENHGTNLGATFTSDVPSICDGQAISFDGVDDLVKLTSPLPLNGQDYTVAVWLKTLDDGNYIIHSWSPYTGQKWTEMESFILSVGISPLVTLIYQSGEGMIDASIPNELVADGTWHHLAFTRRDSDFQVRSFLDGSFYGIGNFTRGYTEPEETVIGGSAGDPPYGPTAAYAGLLDDLRVYGRILSDVEILLLATTCLDCNGNGSPDDCDIESGGSEDCDADGVPDECEPDIDDDGVPNEGDICRCVLVPGGVSVEGRPLGDFDLDCDVDLDDYAVFAANFVNGPECLNADANKDGEVDPLDSGYVLARFGECP